MNKLLFKKRTILMLGLLLVAVIGVSYAWLQVTLYSNSTSTVQVGTLNLKLGETQEGIQLKNAIPISDEKGLKTEEYTFTLTNDGNITSDYTVYLDDAELAEGQVRLSDDTVKYHLVKNGEERSPALVSTLGKNANRVLDSGKLEPGATNTYTLKVWIDYNADNSIMGKVFSTKIRVEATQENVTSDSSEEIELDVNSEPQRIDLKGEDANKFIFDSSDKEVVDVDENGTITQKGIGQAVILITNKETSETRKITVSVTKTLTITYHKDDGISFIEKETDTCKLEAKGQKSCQITLPKTTVSDGYTLIGWNTSASADQGKEELEKIEISEDTTYYAISSKNAVKFIANFDKNGVGVASIKQAKLSCKTKPDQEETCEIILPKFSVKEGYEGLGWSTDKDATEGIAPGQKVPLTQDTTFYAITKKKAVTFEATFYKNGAASQTNEIGEPVDTNTVTRSCTTEEIYNNKEESKNIPTCEITSPIIEGSGNTPTVLGYATNKGATEAILGVNQSIQLSKNITYYAVTRKDPVTRTATFIKNGTGVETIGGQSGTITQECEIKASYNGKKQETSCDVVAPSIEVKEGYSKVGWNIDPNAEIGFDNITLNKDETLYSISKKNAVTLTAKFHKNGAVAQDGSTDEIYEKTCELPEVYNDQKQDTSCKIKLPVITASSNTPTVVGYVQTATAIVPIAGDEVTITGTEDYYAITKKEAEDVNVTYQLNGARYVTLDGKRYTKDFSILVCHKPETWNGEKQGDCEFTLPTIKGSTNTPTIIGWSASPDNHEALYRSGQEQTAISGSVVLYAQTIKNAVTYRVRNYGVGKNVSAIQASGAKKSCTIDATYNGEKQETECVIEQSDLPTITAKNGYEAAGWTSIGPDSLEGSSTLVLNRTNTNKTWYAYAIGNAFKVEYYSDGKKDSEEELSVSDDIMLKIIEKKGYTLKGWDTDSSATTVVYKVGETISGLTPQKGQIIKLYAVWEDDTAPECSFGHVSVTTTGNTTEMKLTCKDYGSGLGEQPLTEDSFILSDPTYGEIVSIGSPIAIENGYEYLLTLKGLSSSTEGSATENVPGRFNIKLKENRIIDQLGNANESVTSDHVEVYGHRHTATFTKDNNAVESIGSTSSSCITKGTSLTCEITTPTITEKPDYEVIGWNQDSDATDGITPTSRVTLSEDVTYYTITRYRDRKVRATFHLNGARLLDDQDNDIIKECRISESLSSDDASCDIVVPIISASENTPRVLGYATTPNETNEANMINQANRKIVISVTNDIDYYAITKKDAVTYHAEFVRNGIGVTDIGKTQDQCTINAAYNGNLQATSCEINEPNIEVKSGYTKIGWNTEANAKTSLANNGKLNITTDHIQYFSISKKNKILLTASFYQNGSSSIEGLQEGEDKVDKTCELKEVYNNEPQDTECTISTPDIVASSNTPIVLGYNTDKDAVTGILQPNIEIPITNNIKYYAITTNEPKRVQITFHRNHATSLDHSSEDMIDKICNIPQTYNGVKQDTDCDITSPTIEASRNTPDVIGYSTATDKHEMEWSAGTIKKVRESANYYAQTKKNEVTYRIGAFAVGKNVSNISSTDGIDCTIDATYNGESQPNSCTVESSNLPTITPKVGYTSIGWTNSSTNTENASSAITLIEDVDTYYAHATSNSYTIKYHDQNTEVGFTGVKVDEEIGLSTVSELGIEKEGYHFKGWATSPEDSTVVYQDGATVSNLATEEGAIVSLYAVWQDDIAPVCHFENEGTIETGATKELILTCTDQGSGLSSQNLTVDNFQTSNGYGSVMSVSAPEQITNGYKYIVTVKGVSSGGEGQTTGTFTAMLKAQAIKDNADNKNQQIESSNITVNGITFTAHFINQGIGIASDDDFESTKSCTTTGSDTSCVISFPGIRVLENYTVVGWNTNQNATVATHASGSNTLNHDNTNENHTQTYYSITYKNAITYSVDWNANGAGLSQSTSSCTIDKVYNETEETKQATSCTVTAPTITRVGYDIIGYHTNENATESILSNGATLELDRDKGPYYAITRKDINITWTKDDDGTRIGATKSSCSIYNKQENCSINIPFIEHDTRVIEGWYDLSGNKFSDNPGSQTVTKQVSETATYIAKTRLYRADEVSYSNSSSTCTNAQCAIDEISEMLK